MFFNQFPLIPYENSDNSLKVATNLLRRIDIRSKVKDNSILYDTYDVKEGEMPEHIAHKLYGNSELHWIVLMVNNITDLYRDWPMPVPNFLRFLNDKYDNPDGIHHYEITQTSGNTTIKVNVGANNDNYPSATPITNREYEESLQDEKRKIRLLDQRYVQLFIDNYKELIKERTI